MPTIFNTDPAKVDLECTQNDTIFMEFEVTMEVLSTGMKFYVEAFNVPKQGIDYYMVGLDMTVRRKDGVIIKEWSSIGTPAAISINPFFDGEFDLNDSNGIDDVGIFDYDVQVRDPGLGGSTYTIMRGTFRVNKK